MCLQIIVFNVISLITDKTHFQSCSSLTVFWDKLNWQLLSTGKGKKNKPSLGLCWIFAFLSLSLGHWNSEKYESRHLHSRYQLWKSWHSLSLGNLIWFLSPTSISEYLTWIHSVSISKGLCWPGHCARHSGWFYRNYPPQWLHKPSQVSYCTEHESYSTTIFTALSDLNYSSHNTFWSVNACSSSIPTV